MKSMIFLAIVSGMTFGNAFADPIRIGADPANPPYSETDASGKLTGFERELGDALCARMARECVWETRKRDDLLPGLGAAEFDAVMAALPVDGDHGAGIAMTQAYLYPGVYAFAGLPDSKQLFGSGVFAVLGERDLTDWAAHTGYSVETYPSLDAAISAVHDGKADAILAPRPMLAKLIGESGGTFAFIRRTVKLESGFAVAVRDTDTDLRFAFEDALFEMGEDGSLEALAAKWFGMSAVAK